MQVGPTLSRTRTSPRSGRRRCCSFFSRPHARAGARLFYARSRLALPRPRRSDTWHAHAHRERASALVVATCLLLFLLSLRRNGRRRRRGHPPAPGQPGPQQGARRPAGARGLVWAGPEGVGGAAHRKHMRRRRRRRRFSFFLSASAIPPCLARHRRSARRPAPRATAVTPARQTGVRSTRTALTLPSSVFTLLPLTTNRSPPNKSCWKRASSRTPSSSRPSRRSRMRPNWRSTGCASARALKTMCGACGGTRRRGPR